MANRARASSITSISSLDSLFDEPLVTSNVALPAATGSVPTPDPVQPAHTLPPPPLEHRPSYVCDPRIVIDLPWFDSNFSSLPTKRSVARRCGRLGNSTEFETGDIIGPGPMSVVSAPCKSHRNYLFMAIRFQVSQVSPIVESSWLASFVSEEDSDDKISPEVSVGVSEALSVWLVSD